MTVVPMEGISRAFSLKAALSNLWSMSGWCSPVLILSQCGIMLASYAARSGVGPGWPCWKEIYCV